jgi:hypothetical protein
LPSTLSAPGTVVQALVISREKIEGARGAGIQCEKAVRDGGDFRFGCGGGIGDEGEALGAGKHVVLIWKVVGWQDSLDGRKSMVLDGSDLKSHGMILAAARGAAGRKAARP